MLEHESSLLQKSGKNFFDSAMATGEQKLSEGTVVTGGEGKKITQRTWRLLGSKIGQRA